MKISGVVVVVSYLQKDSGHERPFARLGQAELARIFPSQLQISPGSRLRIGFDNVDVGSKYQFLVSAGLTIRERTRRVDIHGSVHFAYWNPLCCSSGMVPAMPGVSTTPSIR
jgi:hypothetical protein